MPNPTPEQLKKHDDLIEEMGLYLETDDDPEGGMTEEVQG